MVTTGSTRRISEPSYWSSPSSLAILSMETTGSPSAMVSRVLTRRAGTGSTTSLLGATSFDSGSPDPGTAVVHVRVEAPTSVAPKVEAALQIFQLFHVKVDG